MREKPKWEEPAPGELSRVVLNRGHSLEPRRELVKLQERRPHPETDPRGLAWSPSRAPCFKHLSGDSIVFTPSLFPHPPF